MEKDNKRVSSGKINQLSGVLLAMVILLTITVPVLASQSDADIQKLYKGEKAFGHISELINLGPRIAGGEAEKTAAEYIASKMISYGLNVTTQEFPILYFEDKGSTLQVVNGETLNPNTLGYSPPGEYIEKYIIDCGLGYPEDIPAEALGNICLIQRGSKAPPQSTGYFWFKTQNAASAGALAAIIYNNGPGNFFGTLTFVTDIPAVAISGEEGGYLINLLETGLVKIDLKVDTLAEDRTSQNVIGTLEGIDPEQGIVYMGGHYDSVSAGPGANDDASGVGAMLEAARVLSTEGHRTKATLKFLAFGSEETGLDGSYNYVDENSEEISSKGIGMINLDMIGVGDTSLIGNIDWSNSNLTNFTRIKASNMNLTWAPFTASSNSDHTYFEAAGVPAVFINQYPDPYYHTYQDTIDKINPVNLEGNGELATASMYDWAKNPVHREKKAIHLEKVQVYHDKVLLDK